jgi:hypothetical protein
VTVVPAKTAKGAAAPRLTGAGAARVVDCATVKAAVPGTSVRPTANQPIYARPDHGVRDHLMYRSRGQACPAPDVAPAT